MTANCALNALSPVLMTGREEYWVAADNVDVWRFDMVFVPDDMTLEATSAGADRKAEAIEAAEEERLVSP